MKTRIPFSCSVVFVVATLLGDISAWGQLVDQSLWLDRTRESELTLRGGKLPGKVVAETKDDGRDYVVLETPRGGLLKIDKARVVRDERERSAIVNDYRSRLKAMRADSSVAHLEMAEWIRKMSGSRVLANEYEFHLQEAVRIDPKIDQAWKLLGYQEINGDWFLPANKWENHGYTRTKTSRGWVPVSAVERRSQREAYEAEVAEQRKIYRKWQRAIPKYADERAMARDLGQILTPALLPDVIEDAKKANAIPLRLLYVEAIGTVPSRLAQRALIFFAIQEPNPTVQDRALSMLKQEHYDHAEIARSVARELLVSKQNADVRRSAIVIRELEQKNTILELINALQTQHQFKNPNATQPGSINTGFDNTGRVGGLSMGGDQPAVLTRTFRNEEVLKTLQEFTNQDFGYDEGLWKAWYSSANTVQITDLRGIE